MLEDLVQRPFALARHRSTIFGPHLDDYFCSFSKQGFAEAALRRYLFVITRFGEYLARRSIHQLVDIDDGAVAGFLKREKRRLSRCKVRARLLADTRRIIESLLLQLDVRTAGSDDVLPGVVGDFCRWLSVDRGLQAITIEGYRHYLDQLLVHLGSDGSAKSLSDMAIRDIDAYIVAAGRRYGRRSISQACSAIRAFLRFLYLRGVVDHDLSSTVITPKFYALERLPCALPWETVQRVFDAVDECTAQGRRDRAILLMLVTYGVRPGEIVKLRIEDIDWRHDTIQFRRSKNGRPLSFPLTRDVGEAVVTYLECGRPQTSARELFIRMTAPHIALNRGSSVSFLVRKYLLKAGVESRHMGAYVIRHSLAVHLLRNNHSLKTITDVLGHGDPTIAYHYTKLGLDDLHGVALGAGEVLP